MTAPDDNPYTVTEVLDASDASGTLGPKTAAVGMVLTMGLLLLYLFVVAVSVYEILYTGWRVSYVIEGTLAASFAAYSGLVLRRFNNRNPTAVRYSFGTPVLLGLWIYPGTFAVINFIASLLGF